MLRRAETVLTNKAGGFILLDIKTILRSYYNLDSVVLEKKMDKSANRKKNLETRTQFHKFLIYEKSTETTVISISGDGSMLYPYEKHKI